MEKEILPLSESNLAVAKKGYHDGRFSQFELLDTQRTLLEARERHIETALNYHTLSLEIDRLIGGRIQ